MTKAYIQPTPGNDQRPGTISLMSTTDYDPNAPRPTTPLLIGKYVVHTPLTIYMIMFGGVIVGTQVSMPSAADCDAASNRERNRRAAIEEARVARAAKIEASNAKARATRAKRKAANNGRAKEAA